MRKCLDIKHAPIGFHWKMVSKSCPSLKRKSGNGDLLFFAYLVRICKSHRSALAFFC
ncbi:hypothetical protein LEP1GSC202_2986 [Leptospira yanagawae serovar Saopaulo str. Sao Paulo = ATCC 700523]|uniref:Uncharacterized protein n=1 Tax=Leptospira yanagawae serovar Saopaulo str. Sao Paulo = ATCC 700523 TaxID=1249483 RepID=A0A5E8H7V9_9LEPT|nr:hypothetical protein LEP1GSC202_2986 [Leptospira yanagawae serovar Saopaulo str. Sao Paulo = ATCC 700523]